MKSVKVFLSLLPLFALASCGKGAPLSREDYSDGESGETAERVSDLKEEDYPLFPAKFARHLSALSSYKAVTKGQTKAHVLIVDATQSIDVTLIKGEYSFLKNESHGDYANTFHESYFHGEEALLRDSASSEFSKKPLSEYKDTYGVYPFDPSIEGYGIGEGMVRTVEKVDAEVGYAFKMVFEPKKATNNVRIQMKKFGGLDDYPSFSKIHITVTVQDDYSPISTHVEASYKAKKVVETDCRQTYDVTYSDINGTVEPPNLAEIREQYQF